ncbi:MAG: hypothetical protein ABTQ31_09555 [Rhizobiaceae bacterium]
MPWPARLAGIAARAAHAILHVPGRLADFSFRGRKPLFAGDPLTLCGRGEGDGYAPWAEGPCGGAAMAAGARRMTPGG